MLGNYFKIAYRNLIRNKRYSLIQVTGLGLGIAAFLSIFLFVHYELTFDQHNEHFDRIARITTTLKAPESDLSFATTPYPLAEALKREYPEVEAVVRLESSTATVKFENELISEPDFHLADQSIFSVFSFSIIAGDTANALSASNSIVLTESTAKKYFPIPKDALGTTFVCDQKPLRVTAVIADPPANSDTRIKALRSADFSKATSWMEDDFPVYTFILFRQKTDLPGFSVKINDLARRYLQPELDRMGAKDYHAGFQVEPLEDVHFSEGKLLDTPKGNRRLNYLFSLLGLVIIVISLLNYVNLTTAKSGERGKEIGIRKVTGARPFELAGQFITESFLVIGLAWMVAFLLVILVTPFFNRLFGTAISFIWQDHLLLLTGIFLFSTLITSLYPAFVLSGYNPADILKGNRRTPIKGVWVRKGVVIVQFATTFILIASTLIVYEQVKYITDTNQDFNLSQVISVSVPTDEEYRSRVRTFSESVRQLPETGIVTVGNGSQGNDVTLASTFGNSNGRKRELFCNYFLIDPNFIPLFQIPVVAGRNLSDSLLTDRQEAFIVNEAFVQTMGWSDPIGQPLEGFERKGKVVGVVKNFYYKSMHNLVEPLVMIYRTEAPWFVSMSLSPSGLSKVKAEWERIFPDKVFDYRFLEEEYATQYRKDTITVYTFGYFTALAIFISCLGLYGLVTLVTARRIREVGIRKTLGASIPTIVMLLSKDFVKLVLLAVLTATPVAWYAMDKWLENFAYRIELEWLLFFVAGLLAISISMLTVGWQTVKAAIANPINSLRI